jgi:hypothetical protein
MSSPIPLSMPDDLLAIVRETAQDTGLSQQDVMRQSIKAGLPAVREKFKGERGLKPFTKEEARRAFAPDPEWDKLEAHMAKHSAHSIPEPD